MMEWSKISALGELDWWNSENCIKIFKNAHKYEILLNNFVNFWKFEY